MGVSGGAPKNPTSDIILPARFNEHGSEALRWIFGIDRMRDSNDARTCELKENFMTKREKHKPVSRLETGCTRIWHKNGPKTND